MRIFATLLFAAFLALSSCAAAPTLTAVQHVTDAVGNGFCTAFSINDKQRLFATAAHCVNEAEIYPLQPHLFGHRIDIKKIDLLTDLAVVQAVLGQTPLKVARTVMIPNDETSVYGFVRDREFSTTYKGTFKQHALYFNRELHRLSLIALFDMKIEEGQSGSPIMNQAGEVVSVAQLWFYNEKLGGGPPQVVFYEFVREFLPTVQ